MTQISKTILRVALVALGLLMVPLVASQVVEGWNWNAGAVNARHGMDRSPPWLDHHAVNRFARSLA